MAGNPLGPFVAKMADTAAANLFHPPSPVIISASVIKQTKQRKKEEKSRSFDFYDAPQEMALEAGEKTGTRTKGELQPAPKQGYFWSFHQDPQRAGRYGTNDGRYSDTRK